jgi:hypothetical protein
MEAGWAHATSIKRVPLVATVASPMIALDRRPAAERTSNVRASGLETFLLPAIYCCWLILDQTHAQTSTAILFGFSFGLFCLSLRLKLEFSLWAFWTREDIDYNLG